jgi:hypothetical protein
MIRKKANAIKTKKRWVDIKVINIKQALIIIEFLLKVAKRPHPFKTDDMIAYNPVALNFKTSPRVLRDLRWQGLITYEVPDKSSGLYILYSSYKKLLRSLAYVKHGGYYINKRTPVLVGQRCGVSIKQTSLL